MPCLKWHELVKQQAERVATAPNSIFDFPALAGAAKKWYSTEIARIVTNPEAIAEESRQRLLLAQVRPDK